MTEHKSIMTDIWDYCYICGRRATETHHIFGGANRSLSDRYGLVIPLCHSCHNEPPGGIHFDPDVRREIQALAQAQFERAYPDQDFLKIFGKNYR